MNAKDLLIQTDLAVTSFTNESTHKDQQRQFFLKDTQKNISAQIADFKLFPISFLLHKYNVLTFNLIWSNEIH